MSLEHDSEPDFQPTARRRAEARSQGRVPYSSHFSTALAWGGTAFLLVCQGPAVVRECGRWVRQSLVMDPVTRAQELSAERFVDGRLLTSAAVLLVSLWVMNVALRWLQMGLLWRPDNLQPRLDRLSPMRGLRRLFSGDGCVRGGVAFLRITLTGGLIVLMLYSELPALASLSAQSPARITVSLGELLVSFLTRLCGLAIGIAAVDLGWQWWKHERDLRMTEAQRRDELRDAGPRGREPQRNVLVQLRGASSIAPSPGSGTFAE